MTRPNNETRNRVTISFPSDIEYSMVRELAEVSRLANYSHRLHGYLRVFTRKTTPEIFLITPKAKQKQMFELKESQERSKLLLSMTLKWLASCLLALIQAPISLNSK